MIHLQASLIGLLDGDGVALKATIKNATAGRSPTSRFKLRRVSNEIKP